MNPFRRVARAQASRRLPDEQLAVAWQAVSLLLDYPTMEWVQSHDAIRRAVAGLPDGVRMPLSSFLDHVASQPLEDVQRAYVETFDHTRKCCLYLTYFTFGDTRRRGVALVQFKQAYRKAGMDLTAEELPDHLGVVLEFGATADVPVAALASKANGAATHSVPPPVIAERTIEAASVSPTAPLAPSMSSNVRAYVPGGAAPGIGWFTLNGTPFPPVGARLTGPYVSEPSTLPGPS